MTATRMRLLAASIGALLAMDAASLAQSRDQVAPQRRAQTVRPRIRIPASPQIYYRECVDGYRQVWRPYWNETVIMPYMYCHWVPG